MIKKIALGILGLLVLFVIVVAMQPSKMHIERTAKFSAPPAAVYAQMNSLRKGAEWSPWSRLDPAMKKSWEGPEEGVGAIYRWDGNDQVGEGSMTILESRKDELVKLKLEFVRPMADVATATYAIKPEGSGTSVTWSFDGEQSFMEKAVCLFMDLDAMLGAQFEEGFANLKKVLETPAA